MGCREGLKATVEASVSAVRDAMHWESALTARILPRSVQSRWHLQHWCNVDSSPARVPCGSSAHIASCRLCACRMDLAVAAQGLKMSMQLIVLQITYGKASWR